MYEFIINRHSLDLALNFDFCNATKFELYRRKDNRSFKFIRYDGKNYDELYKFLQNEDDSVFIPSKAHLLPGKLYNVNGKNKFTLISNKALNSVIAANNYLIRQGKCYNLLFNYEVAYYLLSTYDNIKLKTSVQVNQYGKSPVYTTTKDLESISEDSCLRIDRVWFIAVRTMDIDVNKIPSDIVESYLNSKDYYQEFEVFQRDGKVGLVAWRSNEIIPPIYKNIVVENYRAYLQNDDGYWAEYNLKANRLRSDFIYADIQFDAQKGFVTAKIEDRQIVLHSPFAKKDNIICKGDNGFYGVKQGDNWLIPAEYDFISLWKDSDRFEVFKDGKYGLFDSEGHCIFPCLYETFDAPSSDMNVFKVCFNDKWGVVSLGNKVLHDFTLNDENLELLESEYHNCINQMLNQLYNKRVFLHLQLLKRNVEEEYFVMRIVGFNRIFKIYRNFLPRQIFDNCMNSYWTAVNTLKKLAIRVDENGRIIVDYPATLNWLEYRKKVYALKPQDTVMGFVHSIEENRIIVKLDNGIFGVMSGVEVDKYKVGEQLYLIVEQIKNTKILLRES